MSKYWNYNDGEFYIGFGGTAIVYLEENPCKCCPNSVLKVIKFLGKRRESSSTIYFKNMPKDLKKFIKDTHLIHLKSKENFTEKELEFWENFNRKSFKKYF